MRKCFASLVLILTIGSCSNTPEMETGAIKTLQIIKKALEQHSDSKTFVDARNLLSREQIDAANIPVLYVQLASGQNGTLTPYPGEGIGQTWLSADGATITTDQGILKASRGLGDDLMGSKSSIPTWSKIKSEKQSFSREVSYITGNNSISVRSFECNIQKISNMEVIEIWGKYFKTTKFEEICLDGGLEIKNYYYVDIQAIVRRSLQYHSDTIGSILLVRLDK